MLAIGAGLMISGAARAVELELKGDAPGVSLLDFCEKYRRPAKGSPEIHAPHLDFGNTFRDAKWGDGKPDYRSDLVISVSKLLPFERSTERFGQPDETLAGAPVRIEYQFVAENRDDWDAMRFDLGGVKPRDWTYWNDRAKVAAQRAKLMMIFVWFPEDDFGRINSALIVKFGKPTGSRVVALKNAMGAVFESQENHWASDSIHLYIRQRTSRVDQGLVSLVDDTLFAKSVSASEESAKAAVTDL